MTHDPHEHIPDLLDFRNYKGEWVAYHRKKVVAHDRDFSKVVAVVERDYPGAVLDFVPEGDYWAF